MVSGVLAVFFHYGKVQQCRILEFPFYVRWPGRALPTNLTCDVTSRLVDEDWERGFLETRNDVIQWSNLQTNLETKLIKWCILLHLLLFWLRENTHSFVWNSDQQREDTFIGAKKRTFAPKSDSITIFAFLSTFNNIFGHSFASFDIQKRKIYFH